MTRTLTKLAVSLLLLALLATSSGCTSTWGYSGDDADYYYQRARVANYEAFPGAYSGGAYARYGRYGPTGRY